MTLPSGRRLGPYEIVAPLGAGGMGEVYRARDTRLGREVAVKVLPQQLSANPDLRARFEREARAVSSLNHPHICTLFDVGREGDTDYLVMELVEGHTLAERLAQGALPLEDSLSIARQIAEALEEAHERGIVHRDLKPANIKLTPDHKVKVLDFGLAKALDPSGANPTESQVLHSPTLTHRATQMGTILGTAAYMAPEQAVGGVVDRRADIWAFGVVFYEMLTGKRLFDGETTSHVLASVLKDAPDFTALPAATPERIVNLVRRCLRKKPRERLQAMGDARVVIEEVLADPHRDEQNAAARVATTPGAGRPSKLPWVVAGAGVVMALGFAMLWRGARHSAAPSRVLEAAFVAPDGTGFGDTFALSPDGRRIVFEAYDQSTGARALWLRSLDHGAATRLAPTEGGEMPFWSPDGSQLGFFAEGKLQRLDLQAATSQAICDAPTPRGGAWGPDGRIIFTGAFRTGLSIVYASGGTPTELTKLDVARKEKSHRFPVFLPGGKTILFLAQTAEGGTRNDESTIEALEVATAKRTRLITANSSPLFAPSGQILFWHDGALVAVRFDAGSLKIAGDPVSIAAPVAYTQNEEALASVSTEGTLVYREGSRGTFSSLAWFDRNGVGMQVIRDRELFSEFALSHDGKRLAFAVNSPGQGATDLWVQDLVRGAASRLTFEDGGESYPVWSRDDRYIYYANDRRNDGVIFRRSSDGAGSAVEIGTTDTGIWPMDVSADGRWLVVGGVGGESGQDLFRFDLVTKAITPLVSTPFLDEDGILSPDNHLLAYASEQSGRWEVFVQALDGEQGKWQVSSDGGRLPHWRADGRELFFLARPDRVMSVTVEPGPVPRFSSPREVFRHPMEDFDVSPDGQRFVARRPADGDVGKPLTVIANWTQRMPK
jgi:Tol biopolymer transport system component/tRNA A-37 threonylcarbamoyl transferase component Bud32